MHMTCTRTCTCTCTCTCTRAHTRTRAHVHTRTRAHAHMPCVSTPQAAACDCARPFVSLDAPRFSLVRVPPLGSTPLAAPPWQHPSPAPERYRALPCLLRARWSALAGSALPRRGLEEAGPLSAPPLHFSLHDGLAAYDPSGGARTTGCSRGQTGSSPCETLTRCASTRLPTAFSAESTSLSTATLNVLVISIGLPEGARTVQGGYC